MHVHLQKLLLFITLLSCSLSMIATHYINRTGRTIKISNVTAQKRTKKSFMNRKNRMQSGMPNQIVFIELENDREGDLDNHQGDEITITSFRMNDKRKLFPTNNSFNYVVTLNKYHAKYEKFDINHAGQELSGTAKKQKIKKQKNKNVKL